MTRLITYPTGWTHAVHDGHAATEGVVRDLVAQGVPEDDVIVLEGSDAAAGLDRLGASSGVIARMRRGLQFITMDQLPDLHVYELALEQGHVVVGLRVADAALRRRAIEVLTMHGAHFINRFGAWTTEELAPWRGPMLDLPQHMRR